MGLSENPEAGTLNDNAFTIAGAIISLASTEVDSRWLRTIVNGAYETLQKEAEAVVVSGAQAKRGLLTLLMTVGDQHAADSSPNRDADTDAATYTAKCQPTGNNSYRQPCKATKKQTDFHHDFLTCILLLPSAACKRMMIRLASEADAGQGIKTLRRSISELCALDHRNDLQEIRDWLRNKTIASWHLWVSHPTLDLYVADKEGEIVGIGLISKTGEILLNYVSPDARFRGVSKALLSQMEAYASSNGHLMCSMDSTQTARRFYLSQGYKPLTGDSGIGATMTKKLS